ncbi:MAG: carbamoyltransferase HypF, partial [Gammaproteobacteria bacterium]|nr:carbamoyltransferase HypF [Gammaproteobacteria bacterium]
AGALVLGANVVSFEAEGPMRLEAIAGSGETPVPLPLDVRDDGVLITDWAPLLPVLADESRPAAQRAGVFHASMVSALVAQVREIAKTRPIDRVGLAGGVFQNRLLTDAVIRCLGDEGYDVRLPEALPCNDAALSFGQVAEYAAGAR